MKPLAYRQIHLDFHTSEHITNVAEYFDPYQFIDCLRLGNANWVNLFAKCHHGWSYYPTKIGHVHPELQRKDLLGDMVGACKKGNIGVGIYI